MARMVMTHAEWNSLWSVLRMASCHALHDSGFPPERLLQSIWHHQRLRRNSLRLLDGRSLRVLHPGFWNHEPGPDFKGAVLQFGDAVPLSGDVELDLETGGWNAHRHHLNPAFSSVILHVVWKASARPSERPTLELLHFLDAPLEELSVWLESDLADRWPKFLAGHCSAPLRDLCERDLHQLLESAALQRLCGKAGHLAARASEAGWEQALWEALFSGLGYKHNRWPMIRMAELRERLVGDEPPNLIQLQSRLFGISGLLPAPLKIRSAGRGRYFRVLTMCWEKEQDRFKSETLPRKTWRLGGVRPANHPVRRLALASHWLRSNLIERLERWMRGSVKGTGREELLNELQAHDPVWIYRWNFRSEPLPLPRGLLGRGRATDLAMNAILPWFWAQACRKNDQSLRVEVERRYLSWPRGDDNVLLRLARNRLFGGAHATQFKGAAHQQGILQILKSFCDHSNAICAECRFPDLVRRGFRELSVEGKRSEEAGK